MYQPIPGISVATMDIVSTYLRGHSPEVQRAVGRHIEKQRQKQQPKRALCPADDELNLRLELAKRKFRHKGI